VNFSFTPKLYAMYQMANANAAIKALRHVISPGASLSLTPDVRAYMRDYNRYYSLDSGRTRTRYSIYDGTMYGTPTSPERSGYASFDLKNNLEMKIRNLKDTVTGTSKFILLEQFNFNSRYNLYADSLNWSDINLYASTRLFKNLIDVRADGRFNPYIYQDLGNKSFKTINKFEWDQNQRLGRLTYFKTSVSCNLSNSTFASPNNSEENKKKPAFVSGYDYFEMPWSFNFGYDITWDKPFDTAIVFQTLTFGGSLRFTKTLNASFNSGYDFLYKEFTYTTVSITKDLHCWEMSLNFSPLGEHKFYFFKINVKASTLQELKYEKRKNWRDF